MTVYVVGLCGAHGTGKSTIIKEVKKLGFPVIESQLSRRAQAVLGWSSLAPAQESEENMWALQDEILNAMYDRDKAITDSKIVTLVDRTPADVWGYVELWAKRVDEKEGPVNQSRLVAYKNMCRDMAQRYYRHLIVPICEEIEFVPENNRADLDSRDFHEKQVIDFVVGGGLNHSFIQTLDPIYRAHEAAYWLKNET